MKTKRNKALEARAQASEADMERYFQNCPRVSMRLHRNPEQEGDDANVYAEAAINGHVFLIRRGVTVEAPAPLYLLFKQAGERFDVE